MNQGNSSITTEYHNNEKFNLDDLVERVNKCARSYKGFCAFPMWDWSTFFNPYMKGIFLPTNL